MYLCFHGEKPRILNKNNQPTSPFRSHAKMQAVSFFPISMPECMYVCVCVYVMRAHSYPKTPKPKKSPFPEE